MAVGHDRRNPIVYRSMSLPGEPTCLNMCFPGILPSATHTTALGLQCTCRSAFGRTNAHGWSAGNTRNPLRVMELEMVARVGIEPTTRGFSVRCSTN